MRVTNQYVVNAFLTQLNRNNTALNKAQIQISSGKLFQTPSENPVNNALAMQYKTEVVQKNQFIQNIERTMDWLDNTDGALTTIESAMQRARELAVQGANDTLVQADRDAIAEEINQLLLHIVDTANTNIGGEYIFAGYNVTAQPFNILDGQNSELMRDIVTYSLGDARYDINLSNPLDVSYAGNAYRMNSEIEKGVLLDKSISGTELFFDALQINSQPEFAYKIPPLNESLPLSTLNSGKGMQSGIIIITDRNGIDHKISLKDMQRLDDVIFEINSTGSFRAGIEEVPSDTAVALGIYRNAGPTNLLIGLSDPKMVSEFTNLSDLNNGRGVEEGFLSINTRDGRTTRVDISGATTVKDVLDILNAVEGGSLLSAKYNMVQKRIEITDLTGGQGDFSITSLKTQMYIEDLEPHTAQDLGILSNVGNSNLIYSTFDSSSESEATPLSFLNGGKGVESGYISITGRDGSSTTVDLTNAQSFQDVIDAINTQTGGNQTASFDAVSKRLRIEDNTAGAGDFQIEEVFGAAPIKVRDITTVAKNLGLLKSAQGSTLIGDSISPPALTEASLLADINPPPETGSMVIRGADGEPVEIDLTTALTIGDVVGAINATGKFSAAWETSDNRFVISDAGGVAGEHGIQAEEYTNTARDLGFILGTSNHSAHVITGAAITVKSVPTLVGGSDLNPAVTEDTELSSLNSSRTLNKGVNLGYIRITDKAGRFKAIDLRGCKTIKDVLNKINDPANGLYVEAVMNQNRDGIEIIDKNNGATGKLQVIDIDSTTAFDLGITGSTVDTRITGRDLDPALTLSTSIASLRVNDGGVPLGKVYIQSGDFSGEIDLTGVKTIGELIDKLSLTDLNLNIAAWIDPDGKRLNISNTKGQPYIKIRDVGGSDDVTASSLGLGATRSIFTTLIDLRDNLLRNDSKAISEQSIADITRDLERTLRLHAEVGAKTNRAEASKEKQENITLNLNKMLNVVENVDMAEAITRMTQLETAFSAALQTGARVLQTTLMEFLK